MAETFPWQPTSTTSSADISCVSFGHDLHLYALGFRQGAETLLAAVREDRRFRDSLVYPIVYNLRHAVELLLKQVIRAGRHLLDEPGDFPDSHKLDDLWKACKPLLEQIWSDDPAYETVESAIERLVQLDPEGEAFRYPLTRKRKGERQPTIDPELQRLDLGALAADVLGAIDLLDGADTGIDVHADWQREMLEEGRRIEAEMQAEMRAEFADEMRGEW